MKEAKFKVGDKVRILDGSKIEDYTGNWVNTMKKYVGKVATINRLLSDFDGGRRGYRMKEVDYTWDERGLEPAEEVKNVVIWRTGNRVYAKDSITKEQAVARCSPEDKFDFLTGAKLALERLEKLNQPLAVGDEVRVINTGDIYDINWRWVCEHVKDDALKARFAFGVSLGYPKIKKLDDKFIIRVIDEDKAYIEHANPGFGPCHLIDITGLERW